MASSFIYLLDVSSCGFTLFFTVERGPGSVPLFAAKDPLPLPSSASPLVGPPPDEVPLTHAPLIRVVAQVRFPLIVSVERREFIAPFQEAIRGDYPVLRQEQSRGLVVGPQGMRQAPSNTAWRFHDADGAWRVTLASDFVALETTSYTSRDDFLGRIRKVVQALADHIDPRVVDRLGVRYIDRISGKDLDDLPKMVRPEVAGILGSVLAGHAHHSISENVFMLPNGAGQATARWGLVPPRSTVDPGAIEAIEQASWLLDLDTFQAETRPLDVDTLVEQARSFAERIYSIFRWAVTDEFLRRYGGEP